jgi:hypothetical protein
MRKMNLPQLFLASAGKQAKKHSRKEKQTNAYATLKQFLSRLC